ncbi:MAG TPA: hypothetical protein VFS57_08500 [Gemmatimonadaceae bacterium]|nr:hypothetical protein [Gemmatimonadaceae bacterium]
MRKLEIIAAVALLAIASPVMAQGRGRGNGGVPPGHRPPAGMCRIWIDGVPPGHQPAPTDCATAAARVPRNGRIIYGDGTTDRRGTIYDRNGRIIYGRDGRVINPNGQPSGQRCVQRVDVNGRIYTVCDGGTTNSGASSTRAGRIYDGGTSGATNTRVGRIYNGSQVYDRDDDRAYVEQPKAKGKGKYKKPHGHDHDEDEDRN